MITVMLVVRQRWQSERQRADIRRHAVQREGRPLPFARVPVPVTLPAPLIAALWTLKVWVALLQRSHTLTVRLRALHQAPIPAQEKLSLQQYMLHAVHADTYVDNDRRYI